MAESAFAALPARIGHFPVRARLGAGGMAEVYEVWEPWTGVIRALKLQCLLDPHRQAEALREYQLLSELEHPGLPRVYRAGFAEDGRAYVVMDRLCGEPARSWVGAYGAPERPERIEAVVSVLRQVADVLATLHAVSVMQGDLKPSNVLVGPDGHVSLIDLAGARHLRAEQAWIPDGAYYGTYHYTAPEQNARTGVGTAADCYSLGVIAYLLLTGDNPFRAEAVAETLERHREHVPEPPRALVPAIPEAVSRLVMALLAKSPDERPDAATARDVLSGSVAHNPYGQPVPAELRGLADAIRVARVRLRQRPAAEVLVTGEDASGRAAVLRFLAAEAEAAGQRVGWLPSREAEPGPLSSLDLVVAPRLDRWAGEAVRGLRKARGEMGDAAPVLLASARPGVGFLKLFTHGPPIALPRRATAGWGDEHEGEGGVTDERAEAAEGELGVRAREVTAAIALAGALDVEVLAEGLDWSEAEVLAALAEARNAGRLRCRADGAWELTRRAAPPDALASPGAKRALAQRVLDALVDRPVGEAQIRALAAAGRVDDAARELLLWARGVPAARALPLLETLVADLLDSAPARESELELELLRAAAHALLEVAPLDGRVGGWLKRAAERAVGPRADQLAAERLAARRRLERPWRDERALVERATRSPLLLCERALGRARAALDAARWDEAGEEAGVALKAARSEADLERQAAARELLGEVFFARGDLVSAGRELGRSLSILEAARLGRGRVAARLAEVHRVQGRLTLADRVLHASPFTGIGEAPRSGAGGNANGDTGGALDRAWLGVARAANELELARRHAAGALLSALDEEPAAGLASVAWERARLRERLDVARGAPAALCEPPTTPAKRPLLEARWQARRAEALTAHGQLENAVALVTAAEARLAQAGHLPWWAEACAARVRVLGRAGARPPLPEPVRDWLSVTPAFGLRLDYYLAIADRDGGGPAAWDALAQVDAFIPALSPDDRVAFELIPWVVRLRAARR